MALLLPRSVFIHIPKTAGQWIAQALANAGVETRELGVVHASPDELPMLGTLRRGRVVFCFVRHPLTWYPSMWSHRMDDGWDEPIDDPKWFSPRWIEFWAQFTARCRSETFDGFVRACTSSYPDGLVSTLYERYTSGCSRVGRYERLAPDLVDILALAGEEFDQERLLATEPRNVRGGTGTRRADTTYDSSLAELVLETERKALERFGYTSHPQTAGH